jgi:hypothetical protein
MVVDGVLRNMIFNTLVLYISVKSLQNHNALSDLLPCSGSKVTSSKSQSA